MSYKVGVKTKHDKRFVFNGLRFADPKSAGAYGDDLYRRWSSVVEMTVEESDDPPNATFPVPSDRFGVSRGPPSSTGEEGA